MVHMVTINNPPTKKQQSNMIDFHTHILPGVDDGSKSISESVSMLREESRQGIKTVMLTPHFYATENSPIEFLKKRYRAWRELEPYLWPELPNVRLGAEVQYFEGICNVEDIRHLRIVGTDYLLVEMPFSRWTDRMIEDVLELNEWQNTKVVLAHIERYLAIQDSDIWKQLHSCGILMQSNVSFFESWKTRGRAMSMLVDGKIHFLGSDCHNMRSRKPNWDCLPKRAEDIIIQGVHYQALSHIYTDGIHMTFL